MKEQLNEKQGKELKLTKRFKDRDIQSDIDRRVEEIKSEKFGIKKVLFWILLLPFRIVEFFFKFIYGILNVLLIICVGVALVGIIVAIKVYPMYQDAATTAYDKLATLQDSNFRMLQNTVIYDKDGKEIGQINAGNYKYKDITKVSKYIQYGYIATEDKRFMEHIGIDAQSIMRAGLSIIRHNGAVTQGGSTITQQVIKNNVLSQEQTYSRKLVEILIAPKIEQRYSKSKIMEFYVNTNYYGNGCYGVESASRFYFGKHCKDLTLAESAMLCGVSNSPNNYNPVKNMKLARKKMTQVLNNMLQEKYITEKQRKQALKQKIKVVALVDEYDNDNYMMSYALYSSALELMKLDGFKFEYTFDSTSAQEEYRERYEKAYTEKANLLRAGGYKIYTSFDIKLQKKLQKAVDSGLKSYTKKQNNGKYALQGSAVCVNNTTGYVTAMVGGRGTKDEFNRAFLAKRQPGSSIKPLLVYAPAINEGVVTPSTVYNDTTVSWHGWTPLNSGGGHRGEMSVREALARSINTIAFQLYRNTTPSRALKYLDSMKFSTLTYADSTAMSLCLGGFTNGVKVVDLAKGYATIPMAGQYSDRTCIKSIKHETKGTLLSEKSLGDTEHEVFTQDTAFMMCDMMQGTLKESYGTAHKIYDKKMIAGGKTGTTSSNKDAWFSGFSKYYTCSVWVGYDTPKVMDGMYGGTVPAKIWSKFMHGIKKNMTKADFSKPKTISLRKASSGVSYYGNDLSLSHKKSWYSMRKAGTEWYSNLNDELLETNEKEREIQKAFDIAKPKANEFVTYTIRTVDEALSLDKTFATVVSYLDAVNDSYKTKTLLQKCTKHYDKLKAVVKNKWTKYIKEYNKSEAKRNAMREKMAVENSKKAAANNLRQNRINKAEWYLAELNNREYNTDITQLLYKDAQTAIKRLKGYSIYNSYVTRLQSAKAHIDSLPKKITMPEIPEDDEDSDAIDTDKYDDPEVDEYNRLKDRDE